MPIYKIPKSEQEMCSKYIHRKSLRKPETPQLDLHAKIMALEASQQNLEEVSVSSYVMTAIQHINEP